MSEVNKKYNLPEQVVLPSPEELTLPISLFKRGAQTAEVHRLIWIVHVEPTSPQFDPEKIRQVLRKGRSVTFGRDAVHVTIKGETLFCHIGYDGEQCVQFDAQIRGFAIIGGLDVPDTLNIPQTWYETGYVQQAGGGRIEI